MSKLSNIIFLIIIIIFVAPKSYAGLSTKTSNVSGFVTDNISGEVLPFASVQILSIADSSIIKGAMTNEFGKYIIKNINQGKYIFVVSYMGYIDEKQELSIQLRNEKLDFSLKQQSISLSDVDVSAEKILIEKKLRKTTVNVSKNTTISGGTAIDVMQTLPSVDIDIDGKINYRGSDKLVILINGEKSEMVNSLDQIPAYQIEKVDLINNPSAKYKAEGMSGIINIVLKTGDTKKNKTTLMINGGYPENYGGNAGYSMVVGKTHFFINAGAKHNTKYQTKEHFRDNYGNPNASNYYQYDRQDMNLNKLFLNTSVKYVISKKQKIGISLMGSKMFNDANRQINYTNFAKLEDIKSLKTIGIDLVNYTVDSKLNYKYNFTKKRYLSSKIHYSIFDQSQKMENMYFLDLSNSNADLQNTSSQQYNIQSDFSVDYVCPINDSLQFETGYNLEIKDLNNDFVSQNYNTSGAWINDTLLSNIFNYKQLVQSAYVDLNIKYNTFELQLGLRTEHTSNYQNDAHFNSYLDFFPSANISSKINNHFTTFLAYNRRINRPSIKMLNPFSDEYADLLNMHKGNPYLKPEYVNSIELGNKLNFSKVSALFSVYYRNINNAISRVKSASNDSALYVSFLNLDKANFLGSDVSLSYKIYDWWNINSNLNIFYTNLSGVYGNNIVNNSKTAWTFNLTNNFKMPKALTLQIASYYRSKLPSVMGDYKERYYIDLAISKKMFKEKAQLVLKISDIFNTYIFGLDLYAIDDNGLMYSQTNRRKNESRYFILSFIYNINGKKQQGKQKRNFFLESFDK